MLQCFVNIQWIGLGYRCIWFITMLDWFISEFLRRCIRLSLSATRPNRDSARGGHGRQTFYKCAQ